MKKFGAKRIAILILAMAVVTISGVYATWYYSDSSNPSNYSTYTLELTGKEETVGEGSFTIGDSSVKYLNVDQKNDDHNPTLILTTDLVITFKPNSGATSAVLNYGLKSKFKFTAVAVGIYEGSDVLSVSTTEITILPVGSTAGTDEVVWTDNGDGTFSFTFGVSNVGDGSYNDITQYIILDESFVIDTTTKYSTYGTALSSCSIRLDVADYDGSYSA